MKNSKGFVYFLIFSLIAGLISCDTGSNDNNNIALFVVASQKIQEAQKASALKKSMVRMSGKISMPEGAVPSEFIEAANAAGKNSTRGTGIDVANLTGYTYFIEGKNSAGQEVPQDNISFDTDDGTFTITLLPGTWKLKAGIKNGEGTTIYISDEITQTVTSEDSVFNKTFILHPLQKSDGEGQFKINMTVSENVKKVVMKFVSGDSGKWEAAGLDTEVPLTVSDTTVRLPSTTVTMASGSYTVRFLFYDSTAEHPTLLFSSYQTINIYDGLTSDKWNASASIGDAESVIDSSGNFEVTDSLVNSYMISNIYVASAANGGNDNNAGSYYGPVATLNKAFRSIASYGNASGEYTINIKGELSGNFEVPDSINSKAQKITICGANEPVNGVPVDTLTVDTTGTVLKVVSTVPVVIKNLKITGGNGADFGGGIYAQGSGVVVTLGDGALVIENYAKQLGGGVYLKDSARLIINTGAKITKNNVTDENVYGNHGGMALCAVSATVTMNGGEISENKGTETNHRGPIRLKNSSIFDLNGGLVSGNSAIHLGGCFYLEDNSKLNMIGGEISGCQIGDGSPYDALGGAVLTTGTSQFNMSGGKICGNKAKNTGNSVGAGVCVWSAGSSFNLSGGSIEGNSVESGNKWGGAVAVYPNAIFNISGGARIPYDGEIGKNDVYLIRNSENEQGAVTIIGDITSSDNIVATITPQNWVRNSIVLKAETAIITNEVASRFKISDGDFNINKNTSNMKGILSAPIYVAGQGTKGTDYFVCSRGGSTASDAAGTKANPYATLTQALGAIDGGGNEVIYIDGKIVGKSEIPGEFTTEKCSRLTLKGASYLTANADGSPKDALDGDYADRTLVISSAVPVVIENLKITRGWSKDPSMGTKGGGGIRLNENACLELSDGAMVTENYARLWGGGIFVQTGASLYMNGSSYVGDYTERTATAGQYLDVYTTPSTDTDCSNKAGARGGGIYSHGSVYLGYKNEGGSVVERDWTGGVCRNSSEYGGGLYLQEGSLKISSGNIAYNYCGKNGGAIGADGADETDEAYETNVELLGGEIKENVAVLNGGAIYVGKEEEVSVQGNVSIPFGVAGVTGAGKNDIYLKEGKTITVSGTLTPPSGVTTVATITPSAWKRGTEYLSASSSNATALSDAIGKFKLSQDDGGWDRADNISTSETAKKVWITSLIYVASSAASDSTRKVCSAAPSSGNNGTKTSPYATIAAALADSDLSKVDNTITIDGTLSAQTVASSVSLPTGVTEVTLQGYKTSPTATSSAQISGGGTASALWLQKDGLTTIIKDLTVTNGNPEYYGGGIRIGNGTVKLTDGALITGNSAQQKGGGVYVDGGGKLFVYGSALIGDSTTSTTTATSSDKANSAPYGGGIYSNGGAVYLGYSAWTSETDNTPAAITAGYGVRRNYATYSGGGIYTSSSSGNPNVYMQSGNVSYNASGSMGGGMLIGYNAKIQGGTISNNKSKNGGAIYDSANIGAVYISESADISGNTATEKGGAVYVSTVGTLNVKGGTITGNEASVSGGAIYNENILQITGGTITGNTAATAGGAVYNAGTLNMSESANLYTSINAEKTNDIYLPSEKYITLTANLSGSGVVATITPSEWNRGTQVLAGSSFIGANYSRFKVSDTAFSVESHYASSTYTGRIDAPLYVSASGNDETGRGTEALPYKKISKAASQCWGGATDMSTNGRTINIVGTVSGVAQEIPSTVTTSKATAITLKGTTTSAAIDRGLSSGSASATGSALTVNTAVPVTIQSLAIKGGNTTGNGGGINVAAGTVKLANGAKVTDNKANENGGGVYVASGSELFMYSSALIGESTGYTTYASSSSYANKAQSGGGIYSEGSVYLGYSAWSGTSGTTIALTGGVMHNYITGTTNPYGGGGIYCNSGSVTMASGNLSYNGMSTSSSNYVHGGGIYVSTGTFTMNGGTIARNRANCGGGVYVKDSTAKFTMTAGTIGDSSTTSLGSSNEAVDGGGIFVLNGTVKLTGGYVASNYALSTIGGGGGLRIKDGTVTISNTFQYNRAYNYGGAIYNEKDGINVLGGTISNNTANYGGGILSGDCSVTLKDATLESNTATTNGGAVYLSVSSAHKDVILQGSTTIPSSGANDNDVYLKHSGSYYARIVPYPASISDLGLTGSGIVATITPDSYTEGLQVASSKIGYGSSMYDSEIRRVAVTPQATQNWGIADDGKLKAIIGTMTKPSAVGDIVYKDGSASPSTLSSISDTQKASAIAVIFNVSGSNIYGVGLKVIKNNEKGYKWASSDAVGYNVISTGNDGESNFTTMSNLSDWSQRAAKYPAFYLAEQYWQQDSTNLSSGTYITGWYIPSWSEAKFLRLNLYPTVGNVFSTIGTTYADPLEDAFWTSDQTSGDAYSNYANYINPKTGSSGFAKKDSEEYVVRAVRKF